jgi:hypothetical protein
MYAWYFLAVILLRGALGRLGLALAIALTLVVALPRTPFAHDIPPSVKVLAFIKPEGKALRVVLRAPLEAMRDVNFPERGPGYLDVAKVDPLLNDAVTLWIANELHVLENGVELPAPAIVATHISLPSDRSFESYDAAVANARSPRLPDDTEIQWRQAMLDVVLEYAIASDQSNFAIRPALARLGVRTTTVLRFLPPSGGERAFEYLGDPGLVRLDPRWYQAALSFVALGFEHILDGIDHLLFVFCLVIPFRKLRPLIAIVTAFTVAHSITLVASAAGFAPTALWFPPLIEVLIALSIVYMALENIVGAKLERRWMVAFGFGLVHGFGFSFALRESLQFAGSHLAASLVAFNVGVELGQIFVLALAIPVLNVLFRRVVAERMGTIILSAFVAHTAWHWMLARWAVLREYQWELPPLNAAFAAGVMRASMLALVIGGAAWAMTLGYRRLGASGDALAAARDGE